MAIHWIIKGIGISRDTWDKYRKLNPKIAAAFNAGRAEMVDRIAEKLPDILASEMARAQAGDKDALARIFQRVMDEDIRHTVDQDEQGAGGRAVVQIFIPDNGRSQPKTIDALPTRPRDPRLGS